MNKQEKVVIIGSGLGGLSSGVILAKNGYDVTVLEQGNQIGGCLQCFTRHGAKFETGMHFIGSAAPGQTLNKLMKYLEIDEEVTLSQLDSQGYDVVALGGKQYQFANGKEAFVKKMSEYFPDQHANLVKYCDLVEDIANASSLHSLKYAESDAALNMEYQLRSINEVIDEIITNPTLAKVLVGNLPLYAAEKDKTPFSTHAFIMDFYNQSAFRVKGGSDKIAFALTDTIKRYGGEVLTKKKVTKIICDESHAVGVEVNNEEVIPCDIVISDTHPMRTLEMLDTKLIRPAFRKRINNIPQTVGGFSVYLHFKDKTVPYLNYNYYGYQYESPWDCEKYTEESWPKGFLYMHFCPDDGTQYASTGVILSYMQMSDVEKWKGTSVGKRGKAYEEFKKAKAEKLYQSALFVKSLAYAKKLKHDSIYILSAKHHLLALDTEIEPYNLTLNTMNKQEKIAWGKEVITQLKQVADVEKDKFIILAGQNYLTPIKAALKHIETPLEGMKIGERLQFLSEQLK